MGSQQIDGFVFTATVGATAVDKYELVKLSAAKTVIPTTANTDDPIGTGRAPGAIGDVIGVNLLNKQGTLQMVASAAIALNAEVEPAAGGRIQTFTTGTKLGVALQAAAAAGDIIEVLVRRG